MLTLVIGGTRSGKSKWALSYAEGLSNFSKYYYIATAIPFDEEMKERIERHRKDRNPKWSVIEEPTDLPERLSKIDANNCVILIDCLTLWLSNLIYYKRSVETYRELLLQKLEIFREHERSWLIIVTNEVGLGIVPESQIGRYFRDEAGILNQSIAEIADEVFFIIAGLPLQLKGRPVEPHLS